MWTVSVLCTSRKEGRMEIKWEHTGEAGQEEGDKKELKEIDKTQKESRKKTETDIIQQKQRLTTGLRIHVQYLITSPVQLRFR